MDSKFWFYLCKNAILVYKQYVENFENIDIIFIYKCIREFQEIHDFLRIPL